MTTPKAPLEDIIELTEVVEEGIALDPKSDDFPKDKPVGAKSLDLELELDEILFQHTTSTTTPVSPRTPTSGTPTIEQTTSPTWVDLEEEILTDDLDLDDVFQALQSDADVPLDSSSALDLLLEDNTSPITNSSKQDVITQKNDMAGPLLSEPEDDLLSHSLDVLSEATTIPAQEADLQVTTSPVTNQVYPQNIAEQENQKIQDGVMAQGQESPVAEPKQTHETQEVREQLLKELEFRLEALPDKKDVESLSQMLETIQKRVHALENTPAHVVEVTTEQFLAAIPQNPDQLPFVQTLRSAILNELDGKLHALPPREVIEDLLQQVGNAQERLLTLENKPDPVVEINTNQILSALPQTTEHIPFAQSFHNEILNDVEERFHGLMVEKQEQIRDELVTSIDQKLLDIPSASSMSDLTQSVHSLQTVITDLSDTQTKTKDLGTQVQALETELETLRNTLEQQEAARTVLQEKNETQLQEILKLKEELRLVREEMSGLVSSTLFTEHMTALKEELHNYIQTQIPANAAKIIREEIENLVQNMSEEA
ncbi:MAG: hypothetical protein GX043_03740 [Desulfovibrionales bacterium]|nr:hypothetical protein [Desulfovibrionales bacterium]